MEGINRIDAGGGHPLSDQVGVGSDDNREAKREKDLKGACADFESIFVYYLFKSMRQTIPTSGLFDKTPGKDTYSMMMDQKVAEGLAHRGNGLGIQKMLYDQLTRKPPKRGDGTP